MGESKQEIQIDGLEIPDMHIVENPSKQEEIPYVTGTISDSLKPTEVERPVYITPKEKIEPRITINDPPAKESTLDIITENPDFALTGFLEILIRPLNSEHKLSTQFTSNYEIPALELYRLIEKALDCFEFQHRANGDIYQFFLPLSGYQPTLEAIKEVNPRR